MVDHQRGCGWLDIGGFRFIVVAADARAALQVRVEPADSAEAGHT